MIKKFFQEIALMFSNPREVHRVIMCIPLAFAMSHVIYIYMKIPKGVPITNDQLIGAIVGGIIYLGAWFYIFLSDKFDFKLFLRFILAAALSVAAHRLVVRVESFGTAYLTAVSLMAIGFVLIFVISGRITAINDINVWFNVKMSKADDQKNITSNAVDISQRYSSGG